MRTNSLAHARSNSLHLLSVHLQGSVARKGNSHALVLSTHVKSALRLMQPLNNASQIRDVKKVSWCQIA
jgi:hypothetical protein